MQALADVLDALEGLGARAPDEAVHLVALLEQELSQVGAVLARYTGDECFFHDFRLGWEEISGGHFH